MTRDAGALNIQGSSNIVLNGSLISTTVSEARGAIVNISSDILRIVGNNTGLPGVELLANQLNNLGAESLLLGGTRVSTQQGTNLNVTSQSLSIENGAELTAPEVILTAKNDLTLKSGSSLIGSGNITDNDETIILDGNSSLARVSAGPQVNILRTNSNPNSTLTTEAGANLAADKSITLDSSGNLVSNANLDSSTDEGSIAFGASDINIGDVDGIAGISGLVLDDSMLSDLVGSDLGVANSG